MKGSIFTTKTWLLLIVAALLIPAPETLNFRQRARHETPSSDGVEWVDTKDGVIAKSLDRHSSGEKAWLLPGDKLIGISLDGVSKYEMIARARDVQMYLDRTEVGGQIHLPDGAPILS